MTRHWARPLWMRLAALSAMAAAGMLVFAPANRWGLREAAQIQFMHAMATFASATFMNIGASRARHAPALFLSGSVLYLVSALPVLDEFGRARPSLALLGLVPMLAGWCVLAVSASTIDRQPLASFEKG